ncbi:hypothetical protein U0070_018714, partial [Myodes glareolus]
LCQIPVCFPAPRPPLVDCEPRYELPECHRLEGLPGLVQRRRLFADVPGHERLLFVLSKMGVQKEREMQVAALTMSSEPGNFKM